MPLTKFSVDALGVVTVALVTLLVLLGLFCIYRSLYFHIKILRRDLLHLVYFNGPWFARIALVLIAIWWGLWEILRLTLLHQKLKIFSSLIWQKNICKFYIVSNLGFAEPSLFLTLVFLLHASLQKRDSGALSPRWNRKAILYVILFSLPTFILQLVLIFIGPKLYEKINGRPKLAKYFINTSSVVDDGRICTYPLFGTSFIGCFDVILILYTLIIGRRLLLSVVNKLLRRRSYWLMLSIFLLLPLRVSLLALSAFLRAGNLAFEAVSFLSFFVLLFTVVIGVFVLVYRPVADALALRDLGRIEMQDMPYDDYSRDSSSLIAHQSLIDTERNSNASTKRGSVSFRTMIRDEPLPAPATEGINESGIHPAAFQIASPPSGSPSPSARPMLSLTEVRRY